MRAWFKCQGFNLKALVKFKTVFLDAKLIEQIVKKGLRGNFPKTESQDYKSKNFFKETSNISLKLFTLF